MEKQLIFEGSVTICEELVAFKIWKNTGKNVHTHYEWDINPYLVDESQIGPHRGEINIADNLELLFLRFNKYKDEIQHKKDKIYNAIF